MQETQVQILIWEDSTCLGTTKPHNYWSSHALELVLCNEKPLQWEAHTPQLERGRYSPHLEKAPEQQQRASAAKTKKTKTTKSLLFRAVLYSWQNWAESTEVCTIGPVLPPRLSTSHGGVGFFILVNSISHKIYQFNYFKNVLSFYLCIFSSFFLFKNNTGLLKKLEQFSCRMFHYELFWLLPQAVIQFVLVFLVSES